MPKLVRIAPWEEWSKGSCAESLNGKGQKEREVVDICSTSMFQDPIPVLTLLTLLGSMPSCLLLTLPGSVTSEWLAQNQWDLFRQGLVPRWGNKNSFTLRRLLCLPHHRMQYNAASSGEGERDYDWTVDCLILAELHLLQERVLPLQISKLLFNSNWNLSKHPKLWGFPLH